jgi:predicted Zn-ribbon and HTH transcriptional regulator
LPKNRGICTIDEFVYIRVVILFQLHQNLKAMAGKISYTNNILDTPIDLEFANECYRQGFILAIKIFLQRIYSQQPDNSIYPLINMANRLATVQESGFFTVEIMQIKFIHNEKRYEPFINPAHFDFSCNSCGHEFWKQELKRYPEKEGDPIACPNCSSEEIIQL